MPLESVSPLSRCVFEMPDPLERAPYCSRCSENYEKEAAKLTTVHKSFSETAHLPQWLRNTKLNTGDASQVCLFPFCLSSFEHTNLTKCFHSSREFKNCRGNGGTYVCIFILTSMLAHRLHQHSLWQAFIIPARSHNQHFTFPCSSVLIIALQELL